jgi:hypothetical protein
MSLFYDYVDCLVYGDFCIVQDLKTFAFIDQP